MKSQTKTQKTSVKPESRVGCSGTIILKPALQKATQAVSERRHGPDESRKKFAVFEEKRRERQIRDEEQLNSCHQTKIMPESKLLCRAFTLKNQSTRRRNRANCVGRKKGTSYDNNGMCHTSSDVISSPNRNGSPSPYFSLEPLVTTSTNLIFISS